MSSLDAIRHHLGHAGPHLGDLIWWSLTGARIERPEMEKAWADAGLDPVLLPEVPTAEKAFKAAVREAQVGLRDLLLRLGRSDERELVFGIIREFHEADGSLRYSQEARVQLDRRTESLSADDPGHEVVIALAEAYRVLRRTHTPDDVRRAMTRTLDSCAAVTLRENGGVYWVPAQHAGTLRQLQQAIERIGESQVYLLPVHGSDEAKRTLGQAARGAIEQELVALKAEIDGFLASPPERASTLARRFEAFDALRAKADLYRSILKVHVDDLELRLGELTATVEGLLQKKNAA